MTRWAPLAIAVGLLLLALPAAAGELRITVDGMRSPSGVILIGLYDSEASFDRAIELSDKEGFLDALNREVFSSRFRRLWLPEWLLSGWLFLTIIQWLTSRFLDLPAAMAAHPTGVHFSGAERPPLR